MRNAIHCDKCEIEIHPDIWDGCEKYYRVGGEIYCGECFKEWLLDWMSVSLDEVAVAIGVDVVEVEVE